MVLWFAAPACIVVWLVFRDPRLDFRFVVAGALLPKVIDGLAGQPQFGHTLVAAAIVLVLVLLVTLGRRPVRKQLVMLPVGMLLHLVLDGVFSDPELFWWPVLGTEFSDRSLVPAVRTVLVREIAGLAAAAWFVRHFRLGDPRRRRAFLRRGTVEPPR